MVDLHKRFKIPVSHLEDDLLPVEGDGALITDSKGAVYIDLDSNYSATLRWMPPLVITEDQNQPGPRGLRVGAREVEAPARKQHIISGDQA